MSKTILLNQSDWHFTKENPGIPTAVMGEAIALPHTWNAVDGQDGGNDYYRGTCWYTLALAKPNRDNAIDVYIGDTPEDVIGDDVWAETFTRQPEPLTAEEKKAYLSKVTGVCLGSDAFFPFGDNIERARRSGVTAIVQPGGSIRDQQVIDTCNKYGIAMAFCGLRLFHH